METILHLYQLPYDPMYPVVCIDERPCQLIDDVIAPMPMESDKQKRQDYHYKRNGVASLFIAFEPLTGQRIVEVRDRRTKTDYAHFLNKVAQHYQNATQIRLVQDNLNTHEPSAFYQTFEASTALELTQLFDMCYTPKSASWLNMVEIELSVLSKQCLSRRIGHVSELQRQVNAWAEARNRKNVRVNWQFTLNQARQKFDRFYPNTKA
jgi:hypothetical protein